MGKLSEFLSGKKTFLVALAVAVVVGLYQAQVIDEHAYLALFGALNAAGLTTLRFAVEKSGPVSA